MIALLLLLQLVAIIAVNIQLYKIIMNQTELAEHLTTRNAQLNKALIEINTRIDALILAVQNAGNTTPEIDAAVTSLDEVSQALDDLNPDTP
jgi:hypothetical protein